MLNFCGKGLDPSVMLIINCIQLSCAFCFTLERIVAKEDDIQRSLR